MNQDAGAGERIPDTPEKIQGELERLRKQNPENYAMQSARLVYRLKRISDRRPKYALT